LILASASERRVNLLRQVGAVFETIPAEADETLDGVTQPDGYVTELARRKADAVSALIGRDAQSPDMYDHAIIIGADTVVVTGDGEILGKPEGRGDAARMLRTLSGRWHEVYTGVALIEMRKTRRDKNGFGADNAGADGAGADNAETDCAGADNAGADCAGTAASRDRAAGGIFRFADRIVEYEATRVKFCAINEAEINAYTDSGEPFGKAGAYAIQGAGSLFVERIEGCYANVVGLPMRRLCYMLRAFGYDLFMTNILR